jgi:hypothetical protein
MDKAKQAVSGFLSKSGNHDTTVHERVNPHVQHETVQPHQREERQVATDREVHQDHHHTTVQPIKDREVLPEQHHHNLAPVEHRTHDHRNHDQTHSKLQQEAAQFKHQSVRSETQHTSTAAPAVAGEHVHHHVHETIQPVVQKETIEPHVVHTTVPVHEVHHNEPQHHSACNLPAVNMADFKKNGGSLTGRDERVRHVDSAPKSIEHVLGHERGEGQSNTSSLGGRNAGTAGQGISAGSQGGRNVGTTGQGLSGSNRGLGNETSGTTMNQGNTGTTGSNTKPSLLDKLNPKKDADGDGKAGFMH